MTSVVRPARPGLCVPPSAELALAPPPRPPLPERGGLGQALMGGVGSLGMVAFSLGGGNRVFLYVAVGMAVLTVVGSLVLRGGGRRRSRAAFKRASARWHSHRDSLVARAAAAAEQQRHALAIEHPVGHALLARARGAAGRWQPHRADGAAWQVCLGRGEIDARVRIVCAQAEDPLAETDPGLAAAAATAVGGSARVRGAPVVVELAPGRTTVLLGPVGVTRGVARSLIAQLLTSRGPGDLGVTLHVADPAVWHWLVWAPHRVELGGTAATGLLVVEQQPPAASSSDVTQLLLVDSWQAVPPEAFVVDVATMPCAVGPDVLLSEPTLLSGTAAEQVARALAPLGRSGAGTAGGSTLRLLGFPTVSADTVRVRWSSDPTLGVPLGVDEAGDVVRLDLAEAALGGSGPHGLVVGATGSGKSELLRSLVLSLALTHPPDRLAFVLVDWKGGAAFDDVCTLPHVAGLLTNLGDDPRQVARVATSLRAELERRQRVLRDAGAESLAAMRGGPRAAEAPPSLLVVLDEFGELLAAEPDALDVLAMVGRLGRSLGVHLLLSSQRLEEGRLRGLESHLRYRICLRVQSTMESHAVIGTAAAASLPAEPGWGILSVDGTARRFRGAHSSGVLQSPDLRPVRPLALLERRETSAGQAMGTSERVAAVAAITGLAAPPVAPVWLPPLPRTVDPLPVPAGSWELPVGIVDDVTGQRQRPFHLDWRRGTGHVALTAAPSAGATGFVRAVVSAAVRAHPPRSVQLVVLAYGGDLSDLEPLPHLRCLAGPAHPELAAAVLARLAEELTARSLASRGSGTPTDANRPELLVVVDGLARAREDCPDVDAQLTALAAGGLRVGIRLLVTCQRSADLRPGLRELVDTRLEMRLADPGDSLFPRVDAMRMAGAPPGRLMTAGGDEVQVALTPRVADWRAGEPVPRWAPLPARVPAAPDRLGVRAGDLAAVTWSGSGHLLVLGDRGSGRSSLLRQLVCQLSRDPLRRRVLIVDPRRRLTELAGRAGVRWTFGGGDTEAAVTELCGTFTERRRQAADARPSLASTWWQGPEHLVVVDDADLLPGGSYGGPLLPLVDHLRLGAELGCSLVLARTVTGLARSGFEPVLATLRETAAATVLLRGDPAEGVVAGGLRAQPDLPPGRGSWVTGDGHVAVQLGYPSLPEPGIDSTGRAAA